MRPRRYKGPAVDDAFGWQHVLRHEVVPALKQEIIEIPPGCTKAPPSIHTVIMIHGLLQRVEDICVVLDREVEQYRAKLREERAANESSTR